MDNSTEKKFIFLLFFLSGISGLMYEVVWLRMLSRVLGVTNIAAAITLASYMTGLGLGSYIWGRLGDKDKNPLKTYAWLQIAIGITAIIVPVLFYISVPLYKGVFALSNGNAAAVNVIRLLISFFALLVPTTLMGGTLPVLASYTTRKDRLFGSNLSLLYSVNTFGAVLGVILSGFFTIGLMGENDTILIGVVINLIVALGSLNLAKTGGPIEPAAAVAAEEQPGSGISVSYSGRIRNFVLLAVMASGFTALSYELIWNRQLILYLDVSIYAFSSMLAVFLAGIALGSLAMNAIVKKIKNPLFVFGILEIALGFVSVMNLYIFRAFENYPFTRAVSPVGLVLPTAFLFGMIFPAAAMSFAKSADKAGSSVGSIYGFNTIGNVLGSLATGFILIALIGSTKTVIMLALVNASIGFALVFLDKGRAARVRLATGLAIPVIIILALGVFNRDVFLEVIKDKMGLKPDNSKIFFYKECVQGTVTSFEKQGWKQININGVGQTKLCTETQIMAHLPMLLADDPKKFLVICFGMGTIMKSASIYGNLQIETVELVPELYGCFKYYHPGYEGLLTSKNIKTHAEDGRNFLLVSRDKYDVISIDPSPPIDSAGTVNLYTGEFFEICREHLTPGGVMCLWFPANKTKEDNWMIIHTFASVFPDMKIWRGPAGWGFYMTGKKSKIVIDRRKFAAAFKNPEFYSDITEYGKTCATSAQMLGLLFEDTDKMIEYAKKFPIITDDHPYTEFQLFRNVRPRL